MAKLDVVKGGKNACQLDLQGANLTKAQATAVRASIKNTVVDYFGDPNISEVHKDTIEYIQKQIVDSLNEQPMIEVEEIVSSLRAYIDHTSNYTLPYNVSLLDFQENHISKRTLKNINTKVHRYFEKYYKAMYKKVNPDSAPELTLKAKYISDPIVTAHLLDKTGSVAKVVNGLTNLQKKVASYTMKWFERRKKDASRLQQVLSQLQIDAGKIAGIRISDIMLDDVPNGFEKYTAKEKEEIILDQYNKLGSRMMDGQVRQIKIMPIPKNMKSEENKKVRKDLNNKFKFSKIEKGSFPSKKGIPPDRTNVHSMETKDGSERYHYIMVYDNRATSDTKGYTLVYFIGKESTDSKGHKKYHRLGLNGYNVEDIKVVQEGRMIDNGYMEATSSTIKTHSKLKRKPREYTQYKMMSSKNSPPKYNTEIDVQEALRNYVLNTQTSLGSYYKQVQKDFVQNDSLMKAEMQKTIRHLLKINPQFENDPERAKNYLDDILDREAITLNMYQGMEGQIYTGTKYMGTVYGGLRMNDSKDNNVRLYHPNQWTDGYRYEGFTKELENLNEIKKGLTSDIEEAQYELEDLSTSQSKEAAKERGALLADINVRNDRIRQINESMLSIGRILDIFFDPPSEEKARIMRIAEQTVFGETRKHIFDPLDRITDPSLINDYFMQTARNLELMKVKIDYLKSLRNAPPSARDWMNVRMKLALGHNDYYADNPYFSAGIAKVLRSLGFDNISDSSAQISFQMINSYISSRLLGLFPSFENLTQKLNIWQTKTRKHTQPLRQYMRDNYKKDLIEQGIPETSLPDDWTEEMTLYDYVLRKSAVTDFMSVYNNYLAGAEVDISLNSILVPNVYVHEFGNERRILQARLKNWYLKKKAKLQGKDLDDLYNEVFKEGELHGLDIVIWRANNERAKSNLTELKNALTSNKWINLRKDYLKILAYNGMKEHEIKSDEKYLKRMISRIVGQDRKARVNKLLVYKLKQNWIIGEIQDMMGDKAKDIPMTFAGSESNNRESALTEGLQLYMMLGGISQMYEVLDPKAIDFATRYTDAVMFGITPSSLPLVFQGAGKLLMQYKQYPWKQSVFEGRIMMNYFDSLEDTREGWWTKAVEGSKLFATAPLKTLKRRAEGKWDSPEERNAVMLTWRAYATLAFVLAELGIAGGTAGAIASVAGGTQQFLSGFGIRGGGLQVYTFGLVLRLLALGLIDMDEDDEDRVKRSIRYAIAPPVVSMALAIWNTFSDDDDIQKRNLRQLSKIAPFGDAIAGVTEAVAAAIGD